MQLMAKWAVGSSRSRSSFFSSWFTITLLLRDQETTGTAYVSVMLAEVTRPVVEAEEIRNTEKKGGNSLPGVSGWVHPEV